MKYLKQSGSLLVLLILLSCGKSDLEKGIIAYQQKNYLEAIRMLEKAYEQDSVNFQNQEMLALSYLYRGEDLYSKTKNVKSLQGNMDHARALMNEASTDTIVKEYSRMLVILGEAYQVAPTRSSAEKSRYWDNAIKSFKSALQFDSTNAEALSAMEKLRKDNFQNLLDKAKNAYDRGVRTGNTELYFTAKDYLEQAAQFDEKNQEVINLRSKIRQRTRGILDFKQGLALAINKTLYKDKFYTMYIAVRNYTKKPIRLERSKFELIDVKGNSYFIDEKEMGGRKIFGDKCIEDTLLTLQNSYTDGIVVFSVPEEVYMKQLNYKLSDSEIVRKYFR